MAQERAQAVIAIVGESNMVELGDKISRSVGKIAKASDKAAKSTDKIAAALKKTKKGWDDIAGGLNHVTDLIGKAVGLTRSYLDLTREVATSRAMSRQFQRMTGGAAQAAESMDRLRKATRGGVDDAALQKSAILLRRIGVSAAETRQLFGLAAKASAVTGRAATEHVREFSQAIADRSDSVFRSIGVEIDFGQVLQKTSSQIGITTDDLTEAEKRAAILTATIAAMSRQFADVDYDPLIDEINRTEARFDAYILKVKEAVVETIDFGVKVAKRIGKARDDVAPLLGGDRSGPEADAAAAQIMAGIRGTKRAESEDERAARDPHFKALRDRALKARAERARVEANKRRLLEFELKQHGMTIASMNKMVEAEVRFAAAAQKGVDVLRQKDEQTFKMSSAQASYALEIGATSIAIAKFTQAADAAGGDVEKIQKLQAEIFRAAPWKQHADTARLYAAAAKIGADHTGLQAEAMVEMVRQGHAWVDVERAIGRAAVDMRNKMADALGISKQFAETGIPGWAQGKGKKPPRGRARRKDPKKAAGVSWILEQGTEDEITQSLTDLAIEAEKAISALGETTKATFDAEDEQAFQERIARMVQSFERLQQIQDNVARGSLNMAESFASGMGGSAAAVANASEIIVGQIDQISESMELMKKMGKSSTDAFVANVPSMLSASGQLLAGFVEDQQAKAGLLALMELAAGIASIYTNQAEAASHFAAAAMYGLIASGAIGASGGGGGAGAPGGQSTRAAMPNVGVRREDAREQTFSVQINMTGATIIGSDRRRLKNDLASILAEASQSLPPGGFQPS